MDLGLNLDFGFNLDWGLNFHLGFIIRVLLFAKNVYIFKEIMKKKIEKHSYSHKHQRFVLIDGQLYIMTGLAGLSCDEILSLSGGMKSEIDIENRRLIYGENIISGNG